MSLTQFAILKAVAKDKPLMLADGFGLHLLVQPNGKKLWRFRYRFGGRANMLTFGAFPTVSLAAARAKRDDAIHKLPADYPIYRISRQTVAQQSHLTPPYPPKSVA
jgi:Arm DNA-binding domain